MKKVLALFLSIILSLSCFNLLCAAAHATGLESYVAFNNFEACNFTTTTVFSVADTGDASHGKAFYISPSTDWKAIDTKNNALGTYSFNSQSIEIFKEPLDTNTNYILSFDFKVLNPNGGNGFNGNSLSFAPMVAKFASGNDFRNYLPIKTDWTHYTTLFNSGDLDSMQLKINNIGANLDVYIDNYAIQKAVTVSIDGTTEVSPVYIEGNLTDGYLGIGSKVKFMAPKGVEFTDVKCGNDIITPTPDGVFEISNITDNITMKAAIDLDYLKTKFPSDSDNKLLLPLGMSVGEFNDRIGSLSDYVSLEDSSGNAFNSDVIITQNTKICTKTAAPQYTEFKFMADLNNDGKYSVSELVNSIEALFENNKSYDLNLDNKTTVSDVIYMRNNILNTGFVIDQQKLTAAADKISQDAATYGITEDMLEASVANIGNRAKIANVMRKAMRGEKITVAAIGGSITHGEGIPVGDRATLCYAALVYKWWDTMFPGQVEFVNAGISGTNSIFASYRFEGDVLSKNPDFLIIEFAVNDGSGEGSYSYAHESLIRRALKNDCFVMQLFMTAASYGMNCGQLTHGPTGEYYEIPQVSMRDAFWGKTYLRADGREFVFYDAAQKDISITADGTHPNHTGYAMTATIINYTLTDIYRNLEVITANEPDMPKTPKYELASIFESVKLIDPATFTQNDEVKLTSLGGFSKCSDEKNYNSSITMHGVKATVANCEPIVLEIDNCHTFSVISETHNYGMYVKVEIFDKSTGGLLKTDTSRVNTYYNQFTIRTHQGSYENSEGADVVVKITPFIKTDSSVDGEKNANICILRNFSYS